MDLKEINEQIDNLESELKELKWKKIWLLGQKRRIWSAGESYLSKRSTKLLALEKGIALPWDIIDSLKASAILCATNGAFEHLEDVDNYDQWILIRDIYFIIIKNEITTRICLKEKEDEIKAWRKDHKEFMDKWNALNDQMIVANHNKDTPKHVFKTINSEMKSLMDEYKITLSEQLRYL